MASAPRQHRRSPSIRPSTTVHLFSVALAVLLSGCTQVEPVTEGGQTVSEDVFVEAMVALRTSFALNEQGVLAPGASDAILQERGITREHLETFVEVNGTNVPFMADIWARIQLGVDSAFGRGSELEADPDG